MMRRSPREISRKPQRFPTDSKSYPCPFKSSCGICALVNTDYERGLNGKYQEGLKFLQAADVLGNARALPIKPAPKSLGYRCSAKLAVRKNSGAGPRFAIGLYRPGTHEIIKALSSCPLHDPAINALVKDLVLLLEESSLLPWDEKNQSGDLKYLAVRMAHQTKQLMLTFVMQDAKHSLVLRSIAKSLRLRGHKLSSAYLNVHETNDNNVFGSTNEVIFGLGPLKESLCSLDFRLSPTSFFQINPLQAQVIYRRIQELSGHGEGMRVALDLYCGMGPISMLLARNGYRVLGIEENPQAILDAKENLVRNEIKEDEVTFIEGRVEDKLANLPIWAKAPNLIIANPARTGLAAPVLEALKEQARSYSRTDLIYLSCELKTLTRDLSVLKEAGFELKQVEAFDMFAQSDKLEWLAVLGSSKN